MFLINPGTTCWYQRRTDQAALTDRMGRGPPASHLQSTSMLVHLSAKPKSNRLDRWKDMKEHFLVYFSNLFTFSSLTHIHIGNKLILLYSAELTYYSTGQWSVADVKCNTISHCSGREAVAQSSTQRLHMLQHHQAL